MNKTLLAIFLACWMLIPATLGAQESAKAPVKWAISTSMTSADTGILTLTATPAEGWHLYGTHLPEGGPRPTAFDLSGSAGIHFEGAPVAAQKPVETDDPMFGMKLNWWGAPVSFKVRFRLDKERESGRIKVKVTYMACDDNTCAPPATVTLYRNVRKGK